LQQTHVHVRAMYSVQQTRHTLRTL
jgi:hypothetical protein